jgi:hypothetical protein
MKYYVKPRRSVEGPYTEDELVDLLGRLKIGKKTACRSEDDPEGRFRPLSEVVPPVVDRIEDRRVSNARIASSTPHPPSHRKNRSS